MDYSLENAEERQRTSPRWFIPSREARESLKPGDFAKVVFTNFARAEPGAERMWIWVYGVQHDPMDGAPVYVGVLDNEPVCSGVRVARGQLVTFRPRHVVAIDHPRTLKTKVFAALAEVLGPLAFPDPRKR